ncbi:MAG: hypothetical protein ACXV2J_09360 [Actinomycetes bacterium]
MSRSEESPARAGDLAGDEPDVPAATAEGWRTAESQLYAVLLSRPDVYQDVIVLVADTASRLRSLGPSPGALLGAAETSTALVRELIAERGLRAPGIQPDLVGRAGLALRHREVVSEQAMLRRAALLARSRAGGVTWVVLEEAGDWGGDPVAPYRRLEAEAATGRALLVTATPDDDFRTSRHAVEELQVDPDTGRVEGSGDPPTGPHRYANADEREAAAATLRQRPSRSG